MRLSIFSWAALPLVVALTPQAVPAADEHDAPIYRITVVQRSLAAVNYGHRSLPTKVDFRGTVLAPETHGSATIESKAGAVLVHAKFAGLASPAKFGAQYLTYVLWAISPEGQTERLGEVITNHSDDAKLEVTTSLQTFGLLVTAEPYFAVTKPGPVVVMENVLRPDTVGTVEQVSAKYELLPRAESYTVNLPPPGASGGNGAMVSQREYEAVLALYQARNAIQIAKAEGVGERGRDTLAKAERLAQEAEQIRDRKNNSERVIMLARQAVQTAEDARNIAAHDRVVSSGGQ
jgi:hypothetical protein